MGIPGDALGVKNAVKHPAQIKTNMPLGLAPMALHVSRHMGANIFITLWFCMNWVRTNGTKKKIALRNQTFGCAPRIFVMYSPIRLEAPVSTNAAAMVFAPTNMNPISIGICRIASGPESTPNSTFSIQPTSTMTHAGTPSCALKIRARIVRIKIKLPAISWTLVRGGSSVAFWLLPIMGSIGFSGVTLGA